MNKKVRWITQTAVMLSLLVVLQTVTKPLGQYVTGSFVNAVLAVTVLFSGLSSGITVALISPVCAFLLGIAPNFITVLPIMLGNTAFVLVLHLLCRKPLRRQITALVCAACVKFAVLYVLVVKVICGVAAQGLLNQKLGDIVLLAPPMLEMLPVMFSAPQLLTALIGGALALSILPLIKKAR